MTGLDNGEVPETEILRINNEELTKIIQALQSSPQSANLERYIHYISQFVQNPNPANALMINLLSAEFNYPQDVKQPDYFREPAIYKDLYFDRMKEAEESVGISPALRIASSQAVLQKARDLNEALQLGKKGKEVDSFLLEKGWGGIPKMLVLGGSKQDFANYSKVPAEIEFVRRLSNEGRTGDASRGPYATAYISSIRMQTH